MNLDEIFLFLRRLTNDIGRVFEVKNRFLVICVVSFELDASRILVLSGEEMYVTIYFQINF